LSKKSLRDQAYEIIKNKIINCELVPGSPLIEKELMEEIRSSRTPIREALSKLEHENLVTIYPKRGIFVTNITIKDIVDIYTVREAVEPLAARLATPHIDLSQLDPYLQIYADPNRKFDLEEHIRTDREFHSIIANSTGNLYLAQTLLKIYDQNSRIRIMSKLKVKARHNEARQEHYELIKAFMDRDVEKAEMIMKEHIANGKKTAMKIV